MVYHWSQSTCLLFLLRTLEFYHCGPLFCFVFSGIMLLSSLQLQIPLQSRGFLRLIFLQAFKEGNNSTIFALFPSLLLSSVYVSPFLCGCGSGSCRDRLALYFCSDIFASPSRSLLFALISSRRLCLITGMSLFLVLQPASCCLFFRSSRLGILTFTSFTSYYLAMMMTQQPLILFVYSLSLGSSATT